MKSLFGRSNTNGNAPKSQKNNAKGGKIMISVNLAEHQMLHPDQIALGEVRAAGVSRAWSRARRALLGHLTLTITISRLSCTQMIGQGGFAKVHNCVYAGQKAVAKVIDASRMNEEMTYLLTNECTIWARLAHENIVSFFGMAMKESSPPGVMLVCELLPDGALQDALERLRKKQIQETKAVTGVNPNAPGAQLELVGQLHQIARGMTYLHGLSPPVLHRDLKSANILMADGGKRLAIADFGLARYQANAGKKMTAETGSCARAVLAPGLVPPTPRAPRSESLAFLEGATHPRSHIVLRSVCPARSQTGGWRQR